MSSSSGSYETETSSEDDGAIGVVGDDDWIIDINELEIYSVLGQGSFAKVSRGDYLGTDVAIKKIFETTGDMAKYVRRELALLKKLRHPNIVQFIGCCEKNDGVFIITEFVAGGDLRTLIKKAAKSKKMRLSWKRRVQMSIDTAAALNYLASHNFIHRDLKTRNLLVQEDGKIKLCDFGLARKQQEDFSSMTICGTDEYMAPEVLMGDPYNQSADVFSFGMVLCELITLSNPPQRDPNGAYAFPTKQWIKSAKDVGCPESLINLTIACCNDNSEARPSFTVVLKKLKSIYSELATAEKKEKTSAATT